MAFCFWTLHAPGYRLNVSQEIPTKKEYKNQSSRHLHKSICTCTSPLHPQSQPPNTKRQTPYTHRPTQFQQSPIQTSPQKPSSISARGTTPHHTKSRKHTQTTPSSQLEGKSQKPEKKERFERKKRLGGNWRLPCVSCWRFGFWLFAWGCSRFVVWRCVSGRRRWRFTALHCTVLYSTLLCVVFCVVFPCLIVTSQTTTARTRTKIKTKTKAPL